MPPRTSALTLPQPRHSGWEASGPSGELGGRGAVTCFLLLCQPLHLCPDIVQRPQSFPVPLVSSPHSDPEDLGEELLEGKAAPSGLGLLPARTPPGEVSPRTRTSTGTGISPLVAAETHHWVLLLQQPKHKATEGRGWGTQTWPSQRSAQNPGSRNDPTAADLALTPDPGPSKSPVSYSCWLGRHCHSEPLRAFLDLTQVRPSVVELYRGRERQPLRLCGPSSPDPLTKGLLAYNGSRSQQKPHTKR